MSNAGVSRESLRFVVRVAGADAAAAAAAASAVAFRRTGVKRGRVHRRAHQRCAAPRGRAAAAAAHRSAPLYDPGAKCWCQGARARLQRGCSPRAPPGMLWPGRPGARLWAVARRTIQGARKSARGRSKPAKAAKSGGERDGARARAPAAAPAGRAARNAGPGRQAPLGGAG